MAKQQTGAAVRKFHRPGRWEPKPKVEELSVCGQLIDLETGVVGAIPAGSEWDEVVNDLNHRPSLSDLIDR